MQTNRSNAGALLGGALLIVFGLLILVGQIFRTWNWGFILSFAMLAFGSIFFVIMFAGGKQTAPFAIPGSIITGVGLVLLVQSFIHHWEAITYLWTLVILLAGVGIYIMGWYGADEGQLHSGRRVMKAGAILFVIFGAFFEMIFSSFNNMIFPILLIVLGIYLVLTRSGLLGKRRAEAPVDSMPPAAR